MLKYLAVLAVFLCLSNPVIGQSNTRDFDGFHWYDDGIHFTYPLHVAEDAVTFYSPQRIEQPEAVTVVFQNYHEGQGWFPTGGEISIPTMSPDIPSSDFEPSDTAQIKELAFMTGDGVRFVTGSADESDHLVLIYHYQGATDDGNYSINASFPITANQAITEADRIASIDALSPDEFTPNLDALDAIIGSLAVEAPDAMFNTSETSAVIDYEGTSFSYDESLAYRIEVDAVAAITGTDADYTMYGITPGYDRFTFVGYPAFENFQSPHLFIMPTSDFPNEESPYGIALEKLQSLLAAKPSLMGAAHFDPEQTLPMLPLINAAQVIVSHPQYVQFKNGEGIRYLTYYAQDTQPLISSDLFYAFVGMTSDEHYVVAAILPLHAGFLPQGRIAYEIADWERFATQYQTYLDGVFLQIDVMEESVYVPHIQLLDELITSIQVQAQ